MGWRARRPRLLGDALARTNADVRIVVREDVSIDAADLVHHRGDELRVGHVDERLIGPELGVDELCKLVAAREDDARSAAIAARLVSVGVAGKRETGPDRKLEWRARGIARKQLFRLLEPAEANGEGVGLLEHRHFDAVVLEDPNLESLENNAHAVVDLAVGLDLEVDHGASLNVVTGAVDRATVLGQLVEPIRRPEFKILWGVIPRVVIDVMYHFSARQDAPGESGYNEPMLHHVSVSPGHRAHVFRTPNVPNARV